MRKHGIEKIKREQTNLTSTDTNRQPALRNKAKVQNVKNDDGNIHSEESMFAG